MAQQAILAAADRRRGAAAEAAGFIQNGRRRKPKKTDDLREVLYPYQERLYGLFDLWDEDGDGTIDPSEFKRALRMIGVKPTPGAFKRFCDMCDTDHSGNIDLQELQQVLDDYDPPEEAAAEARMAGKPLPIRAALKLYWLINTTAM